MIFRPTPPLRFVLLLFSASLACSRPNPLFGAVESSGGDGSGTAGPGTAAGSDASTPPPADGDGDSGGAAPGTTTQPEAEQTSDGTTEGGETEGEAIEPAATLFINFDGATLSSGDDDATLNQTQLGAVGERLALAPFGGGPKREETMDHLYTLWDSLNVEITDVRPERGDYAMIVVTPTNIAGEGVLGVATQDCGDENPNSVGLVFSSSEDTLSPEEIAVVISHEAGRGYGLESVIGGDIMSTLLMAGATFAQRCLPLSGAPQCPQHRDFCPFGEQSSAAELQASFPWR